ncbi:tRNA pseudouridine synthase D [bacterium HR29]|nr:tRNA pseudouridine synthase D [bacterium HR29]
MSGPRPPAGDGPLPPADFRPDFDAYPMLTGDLPGIGGRIRERVEDFVVEEVPAYLPSGEGEHLYLYVEKVGIATPQLVEHLRDAGGIPEAEIGTAGLKDKRAVARQWISIPRRCQERAAVLEELGVRILDARPHRNKLRTGHLAGNRFRVHIRAARDAESARRILARLAAEGVPNYFGPQRFGREGENAVKGLAVLRGRRFGPRWLERLLVSSVQSLLFNEWLAERMRRGLFDRFLEGDVAKKHATGGEFTVTEPETERERLLRFEISPTGPIFGRKMREAAGPARAFEDEILARYGLARQAFGRRRGDRRFARVPLREWSVEPSPEGLWVSFALPKGAYATAVLREVMKVPLAPGEADEADEPTDELTSGRD